VAFFDFRVGALPGKESVVDADALAGEGFADQLRHHAIVRQRLADKGWPLTYGDTDALLAECWLEQAGPQQQGGDRAAHAGVQVVGYLKLSTEALGRPLKNVAEAAEAAETRRT
jgi:hypothetical protein